MKIQFLQPSITEEDIAEVARVLRKGWLTLSDDTKAFEKNFAEYLGVKEVVATSSCTCSIELALTILGVSSGDEIITTPLTYVATMNPAFHLGAKPVFVDTDPKTGLIDIEKVEEAITEKTKIILIVHLYGQMVDMKKLKEIADRYNIAIVEDAAHAIEAERDGIRSGQLGACACFSFHTAKNLTAGQGGAISTNNPEFAEHARLIRRDGVKNVGPKRLMYEAGYKYIMTDFQAALLSSQLKRIDTMWERRNQLFNRYHETCMQLGIDHPEVEKGVKHACHMFVIWVDPDLRDAIREDLTGAGIETCIHYDPVHLEPFYRELGYKAGMFPIAEQQGFGTITLPMYPDMTDEQQEYILDHLKKFAIS